uniref:glucuronosyltransferase n=1 Tax=Globodera rostochiensis TaxID=31243 RepID=A0A914H0N5_GLORO
MQFMGTIADTLTEAGHEVHFMRLIPNNFTISWPKEVHKAQKIYDFRQMFAENSINVQHLSLLKDPFDGNSFATFLWQSNVWISFMNFAANLCQELTWNDELIRRLEAEQFDVAIAEMYDFCPFAMFHRIGAKTKLAAIAAPLYQVTAKHFGIPAFASYAKPASSTCCLHECLRTYSSRNHIEEPIVRHAFGNDFPKMKEIARNISLIFVNSNQFFEFPRPISNKVINVGGMIEMAQKQLDPKVSRLLDKAKTGAVFVSFGSYTDTQKMPNQMKMALLHTFAQFSDYEFIWKLELSERDAKFFAKHKNVHPVTWTDQKTILLHPKTRAFVSHCGLNSLTESVRAGVPILAIPLFGDQKYNAILAEHKGVGIKLDVKALQTVGAEELFFASLGKVLNDPSYRSNAQMVKRKFELMPFGPKETLIRWVEFAAEFAELNELNLPWEDELGTLAYYSVDVLLFSAVVKPNRECGGNNFYDEKLADKLRDLPQNERASYILMQKLYPTTFKNYFLRPFNEPKLSTVVGEMGIYGTLIGNKLDGSVQHNVQSGHLLRTKLAGVNEGGISVGTGVGDSPYLF